VSDDFFRGEAKLCLIVELRPGDAEVSVREQDGGSRLRSVVENIYLKRSMADASEDAKLIRFSIGIAQCTPVYQAVRNSDCRSAELLYEKLSELIQHLMGGQE